MRLSAAKGSKVFLGDIGRTKELPRPESVDKRFVPGMVVPSLERCGELKDALEFLFGLVGVVGGCIVKTECHGAEMSMGMDACNENRRVSMFEINISCGPTPLIVDDRTPVFAGVRATTRSRTAAREASSKEFQDGFALQNRLSNSTNSSIV